MLILASNVLPLGGLFLHPLTLVTGPSFRDRAALIHKVVDSLAHGRLVTPVIQASAWHTGPSDVVYQVPCKSLVGKLPVRVEMVDVLTQDHDASAIGRSIADDPDAASIFETLTGKSYHKLAASGVVTRTNQQNALLALRAADLLRDPQPSVLVVPDALFGTLGIHDGVQRVVSYLCGVAGIHVTIVAGMSEDGVVQQAVARGDFDAADLFVWNQEK